MMPSRETQIEMFERRMKAAISMLRRRDEELIVLQSLTERARNERRDVEDEITLCRDCLAELQEEGSKWRLT